MRITQNLNQTQFLAALNSLESSISQTQNQISTGLSFTKASQNPVAAGSVNNLNQALSQNQQYQTNANSAQTSLSTEDNALSQVQTQLQTLRGLALQANSGGITSQNLQAIATQAVQVQNTLLSLANTQDGNGQYIFSGYSTQTQPFSLTAAGTQYAGDQGTPQAQIAAGLTVASGDSGNTVFNQIKTGNGTFVVTPYTGNTGTGVVGATTVSNATGSYAGGSYAITFGANGAYSVTNAANTVVASGTYTDGQSIAFGGVQVTLSGTPNSGDIFNLTPSTNQGVFTSVQQLITALQSNPSTAVQKAQFGNSITAALNNIDQALGQTADVRASVGGRLNTITTQLSIAGSQQTQLQQSISSLQGLDYASAISSLDSQNTTLSAALQAYTITQGLSLFKYI
jgi:flagellar hook-associated protein 3 FlgL